MSRYANNNAAVVSNVLTSIQGKESQYADGIESNHTWCKLTAERLAETAPGRPAQILLSMTAGENPVMEASEIQSFLKEQRLRMQKLAARNVQSERQTKYFCQAVRKLQQDVQRGVAEAESKEDYPDYSAKIRQEMDAAANANSQTQLSQEQETKYRDIMKAMGEPVGRAAKKDDDDIEVFQSQAQGASLNCPITGLVFQEPLKNKVCGHVYSKIGIMDMLKRGRNTCPIAGCNNSHVTPQQLVPDTETELQVRRLKRRQQMDDEQRASQAADLMDSDEE